MSAVVFTDRQKQIIERALQLIAEQGIEKLTFRNLARAVGITVPAFYRHFPGKTGILAGILEYFDGIRRGLFREVREGPADSLAAIEAVVLRHCALFEGSPALATLLYPEEIRQNRAELGARVLEMMRYGQGQIAEIVAEGQRRGQIRRDVDPPQLALVVLGALRLIVTRWRLDGHAGKLRDQGRNLARSLVSLLRAPSGEAAKA